jgi:hypothetical protein
VKRIILINLALLYSLRLLGWELSCPSLIELEPSCSDWNYSECSIEVSGKLYYQFFIGSIGGDFEMVSFNLDFDDCDVWDYYENMFGHECWSIHTTDAGQVGLKISLDRLLQIPGDEENFRIIVHASNDLNYSYTTQIIDFKVRVKEPTLSGSWPICYSSSKTFTLSGYPTSGISSIGFDVSSNLYKVSQTNNSVTVRAQSSSTSGTGWIRPKYNMTCGYTLYCPTKSVFVGKFQSIFVDGTPDVCPNSLYVYEAEIPLGHKSSYSYSWIYPSGWYYYSQWDNFVHLQTPILPENMTYGPVRVNVTNECGSSGYSGITTYAGYCGGYFMAAPNPASEYVNIEVDPEKLSKQIVLTEFINTITVSDKMGMILIKDNITSLPYKIETSKLLEGQYVVNIISVRKDGKANDKYNQSIVILVSH